MNVIMVVNVHKIRLDLYMQLPCLLWRFQSPVGAASEPQNLIKKAGSVRELTVEDEKHHGQP